MSDTIRDAGDEEKAQPVEVVSSSQETTPPPSRSDNTKSQFNPGSSFASKAWTYAENAEQHLAKYSLETRGIQRVEPLETHKSTWISYLQAFLLWFSINLAVQNTILGMLGPVVFALSFKDASLCAVFGCVIGCIPVAYITTWGPLSGNRTMIFARYTMGWWPSKLLVILNLIVILGYPMINIVIAGQILSAVSSHSSMSVAVGIVLVAVITWLITTFGIRVFHSYQRYAFIPQLIAMSILFGISGSKFDLASASLGDRRTVIGDRISFLSLNLSAAITYAGGAADFFVYYSPTTRRLPLFAFSLLGLIFSFTLSIVLGIGLASAIPTHSSYESAYYESQGALIVTALSPLHSFGKFLSVVLAFGLVANTVAPTYSSGIDFQILGSAAAKVPRFIWNAIGVIIYTVCALVGRNHLSAIFTNFLALMGYWTAIWIALTVEEQVIFRRRRMGGDGYDWTSWNKREKLPVGVAALIAFLIGWVGAIMSMAQVWYIGPLAKHVGEFGADMGNYVGFSFAALLYPPLRWLELRKFPGR